MERILSQIEAVSEQLKQSQLCQWLNDDTEEDRFAFIPSMLFFVLGFRDIMEAMIVKDPKNALDVKINTHCLEDLDHWKWYLNDLESLGFTYDSWGRGNNEIFKKIWREKSYLTRSLVYDTIHLVKLHQNPLVSLTIIELLEAAFGVFIQFMSKPVYKEGMMNNLQYFGKTHIEKELSHSRGAWVDGVRVFPSEEFKGLVLEEKLYKELSQLVDDVSTQMAAMFDHWYELRNDFHRTISKTGQLEEQLHPVL